MNVLAYIDPGSGSLFIQAVVATILVVPFFLREQIRRGVARLRSRAPQDATMATSRPTDDTTPPARP